MAQNRAQNIILCGFMGTGKTTIGHLVSERLGWDFVDLDHVIETQQGRAIAAIFAQEGEPYFRRLESDLCNELASWRHIVVATGGGAVVNPDNRAALSRAGLVVCLDATPQEIFERLSHLAEIGVRPMLAGEDPAKRITDLLAVRAPAYAAIPHHVTTSGRTPDEIAADVLALWEQGS